MRRRRVVIRHDDDKKGSGCLVGLITICTVVLLCCATIFLFMCVNSYPYTLPKNGLTINLEIVDKIKEAFLKDKKAHETVAAETTETTIPAPVVPIVTYKEFFSSNDRIQIKYPVLSNMQDLDLQTKINTEIYKNAVAIIDLYPVKSYYLKIDATVDTINEKYLSIIYTGKYSKNKILAMASDDDELTKEGEIASENKVYAFSGIGFYPGSNVGAQTSVPQTPAYPGATGLPGTAVPTQPAAGVPGQLPAGANAANAAILQQQAESLVGILRGLEAGGIPQAPAIPAPAQAPKKQTTTTNKSTSASNIFYTNCINLTTGKTISVNDICTSNELAEYILSSSVRFINVDPTKVSKIKTEIKKNKKSYYVDMFDGADFSNFEREKWPKSFSYRKGNTLYFSVPVSKTYGDYVIVEYEIR